MSQRLNIESPLLSYALGVIKGDGWCCLLNKHKKYRVGLRTIDEIFALQFLNSLNTIGIHARIYGPYSPKNKQRYFPNGYVSEIKPTYQVSGNSKPLFEWYHSFNPKTNPDWLKNLESYLYSPERIRLFLKGFYESEGSVSWNRRGRDFQISFYNSDMCLLELVRRLLAKVGWQAAPRLMRDKRNNGHRLDLNRNPYQFLLWLHPCIKQRPRHLRGQNQTKKKREMNRLYAAKKA